MANWLDKYDVGGELDPYGLTTAKKDAVTVVKPRVLTKEENKRVAENRKRKAAEEAAKNRPQLSADTISPEQRAAARKIREQQEYINNSQLAQSLGAMSTNPGLGAIAAQTITEMNPAMSIARLVETGKDPRNNPYGISEDAGVLQNTLGAAGLLGDAFDLGSMINPATEMAVAAIKPALMEQAYKIGQANPKLVNLINNTIPNVKYNAINYTNDLLRQVVGKTLNAPKIPNVVKEAVLNTKPGKTYQLAREGMYPTIKHALGDELNVASYKELKEAFEESSDRFKRGMTSNEFQTTSQLDKNLQDYSRAMALDLRLKFADRLRKFNDPGFAGGEPGYQTRDSLDFLNKEGYDINALTPQERVLMSAYTHGYDSNFNRRDHSLYNISQDLQDYYNQLSNQFNKSVQKNQFNNPNILDRGTYDYTVELVDASGQPIDRKLRSELQVGDIFKDEGFLSTSLPNNNLWGNQLERIIVPEGGVQSYAFPNSMRSSVFPNENEIILPKGLIRRVEEVYPNKKNRETFTTILNPYEKGGKVNKRGGWLDKYEDGGELNYNNYNVSFSPDFVGQGYDTTGRNYSPAWGGQFKDGGKICDSCQKAEDGEKLSVDERRKRVLAKANEIFSNKDLPYQLPDYVVNSKEGQGKADNVCIHGVCGIMTDVGFVPHGYYTNTSFAEHAQDYGFSRSLGDIRLLKPGDIFQWKQATNDQGKPYPTHAQIFKGINPNTGMYQFYDYYNKYHGGEGINSYSKEEIENALRNIDNKDVHEAAQFFSLDPSAVGGIPENPFPYNLSEKEQQQHFADTHSHNTKYSVEQPQYPLLDTDGYDRAQTKNKLVSYFNDKKLDEEIRKKLKITDQELQRVKPLIYGIMDQETDFGNPNAPIRNLKYDIKELLGLGSHSIGPAAVKYEALSPETKKAFNIKSPRDLSDLKNSYIGALDVLTKGADYTDAYINRGEHIGISDKHPLARALYWYNNPSNIIRSDSQTQDLIRDQAKDLWFNMYNPNKKSFGPFGTFETPGDIELRAFNSPLTMDRGSYPDKVIQQSKKLRKTIDFNDPSILENVEVKSIPYSMQSEPVIEGYRPLINYGGFVSDVPVDYSPTPYEEPYFAMGGSIPGSVGFTYARTGNTPSNGKYAKKTLPSAQTGKYLPKEVSGELEPIQLDPEEEAPFMFMGKPYEEPDRSREFPHLVPALPAEELHPISININQKNLGLGEHTFTHQPGMKYDENLEGVPSDTYMLKRTANSYPTDEDVRLNIKMPTSPKDVNFISNYKGAIGYVDQYPTSVPFEGEKHWNIDRFIIDPHFGIGNPNLENDATDKTQQRRNVLADMYKYYLLQNKGNEDLSWKQANEFMTKEIDPRISGPMYEKLRGNINYGSGMGITSIVDNDYVRNFNQLKNSANIPDSKRSEVEREFLKNPVSDKQAKDLAMDWLINYKKMSPKDAEKYYNNLPKKKNGGEMRFYQNGLDFKPKSISKKGKKVIKDDRGQWAHPGEITKIGSNNITMKGVPYPVLGISDLGDIQLMYPDQDYTYRGNSVIEYPMMAQGGQLTKLDQLTNFTNYNTKQPGGWLDKYK